MQYIPLALKARYDWLRLIQCVRADVVRRRAAVIEVSKAEKLQKKK